MARLNKDDLAQMNKHYFQSLEKERLVEVATNLHQLAVEQWERLEQNSRNSSRPPSSDNPYQTETENQEDVNRRSESNQEPEKESPQEKELSSEEAQPIQNQQLILKREEKSSNQGEKRNPGKQPGAEGKWRTKPLVAEEIIPHDPEHCASCNQKLTGENHSPYLGYYVLELKPEKSGFKVVCQLHHYSLARCECGHQTKARPGEGYISCVEGRSVNLKLTEYVLVGEMLATFIASLSVRYRMSRAKIQEFLHDWTGTELSVGTLDRCIREAGIACAPVVEKLVAPITTIRASAFR